MTTTYITLHITHSDLDNFRVEKNFDTNMLISDLKIKLETLTGTNPKFQKLELKDGGTGAVEVLDDETKSLKDYNAVNHQVLHIVDADPEKYVASTQQASVGDTLKPFVLPPEKEAARVEAMKHAKQQKAIADDEKILTVKVGDRCSVKGATTQDPLRKGVVKFVGPVEWTTGLWVGVMFDDPVGKNDGSVKGHRYFTCEPNYGSFVKPNFVVPEI